MRISTRGLVTASGLAFALVAFTACGLDGPVDEGPVDPAESTADESSSGKVDVAVEEDDDGPVDPRESTTDGGSPGQADVTVMDVTVGPRLVDCVGVGPWKCLEVDGELFYESIRGFEHEEGYTYRLKIERYDAFPGEEEPPQDASRYGYRLIEILSRTPR